MLKLQVTLFFIILSTLCVVNCEKSSLKVKCSSDKYTGDVLEKKLALAKTMNKRYGCDVMKDIPKFYELIIDTKYEKIAKYIKENHIDSAKEMFLNHPEMDLEKIIKTTYSSYNDYNIIGFIDVLPEKYLYKGYKIYFDYIKSENDFDLLAASTFIYRAKNYLNHADIKYRKFGEYILKTSPGALTEFPMEKPARIINSNKHFFYSAPNEIDVYGWPLGKAHDFNGTDIWIFHSDNNGISFKIKNQKTQKYLYLVEDKDKEETADRYAYLNDDKKYTKLMEFMIKYRQFGEFMFWNPHFDEYLFSKPDEHSTDVKDYGKKLFSTSGSDTESYFFVENA